MNTKLMKSAMVLAALLGSVSGARASIAAEPIAQPTWPNQCYNYDGGSSCPICGGSCLGGIYLCCNNGANAS